MIELRLWLLSKERIIIFSDQKNLTGWLIRVIFYYYLIAMLQCTLIPNNTQGEIKAELIANDACNKAYTKWNMINAMHKDYQVSSKSASGLKNELKKLQKEINSNKYPISPIKLTSQCERTLYGSIKLITGWMRKLFQVIIYQEWSR